MNLHKSPVNGYYCKNDPGEPNWNTPRLSVNDIEARIVSEFCRGLDVLEIGTGLGVSTREMAKRARKVHTVDIDLWVKNNIVPGLPENVVFWESIENIPKGLGAAFVDGYHEYMQCLKDIEDVKRLVKPGGILLFHDYRMPAVFRAVSVSGLDAVVIETTAGLGLAWNE